MADNHTATTATQDRTGQGRTESHLARGHWCVPANDIIMQVKDLPNKSWCAHRHVENKRREGHGSDLEGQDDDYGNQSCDSFIQCFFFFYGLHVFEEVKKKKKIRYL